MRWVVAVIGVLFLVGWATGAFPFEVLATWSVVLLLIVAAFGGTRRKRDRVAALQRTLFYNESLISYKESIVDHPKGDPRNPGL